MRNSFKLFLSCVAALCMQGLAISQVVVSEDFEGVTSIDDTSLVTTHLGRGFTDPFFPPPFGTSLDFSGESAIVGGRTDDERVYLGTAATDFGLRSFIAEIDVTVRDDFERNSSTSFFGLGPGEGESRSFEEPVGGTPIFLGVAGTRDYLLFDRGEVDRGFFFNRPLAERSEFPGAGEGTHRVRLEHDVNSGEAVYSIDIGSTGNFAHVVTFNTCNNQFDATNSRIFFGGSDSRIFDNFTVELLPGFAVLRGDIDFNGEVNFLDIPRMIGVLSSGEFLPEADCDCDGDIDFLDIPPFIDILAGR